MRRLPIIIGHHAPGERSSMAGDGAFGEWHAFTWEPLIRW
jgi:hypothetical protein